MCSCLCRTDRAGRCLTVARPSFEGGIGHHGFKSLSSVARRKIRLYAAGLRRVKITVAMRVPTSAKLSDGRSRHNPRQPGLWRSAHARNLICAGVSLTSADAGRMARSSPPGFVDCHVIPPQQTRRIKGLLLRSHTEPSPFATEAFLCRCQLRQHCSNSPHCSTTPRSRHRWR